MKLDFPLCAAALTLVLGACGTGSSGGSGDGDGDGDGVEEGDGDGGDGDAGDGDASTGDGDQGDGDASPGGSSGDGDSGDGDSGDGDSGDGDAGTGGSGIGGAPSGWTCDQLAATLEEVLATAQACADQGQVKGLCAGTLETVCGCTVPIAQEGSKAATYYLELFTAFEKKQCVVACTKVACIEFETATCSKETGMCEPDGLLQPY